MPCNSICNINVAINFSINHNETVKLTEKEGASWNFVFFNTFFAVAREQSISRAAESLHLSQPTLSTQLKHLEEELGKTLMIRGTKGSRKIVLTEEGMILRKRAEEILDLVRKNRK